MFDFIKKQKEMAVYAPMDGEAIKIEQVPDEAFSEKILGDGAAIIPENGNVYSPVDGEIIDITDTKHAFCITTNEGTEVLLHIGIDTVNLKGEGFDVKIVSGDKVKAGTKIAQVDLELLKKNNIKTITPVILTEAQNYKITQVHEGKVSGGRDVLFLYKKI
ncbi:MAG: PTS glucose transporter subunit IIA [Clostridia bacterium]|nr:PTS glucose transporter subunit IIA [Clostridia bacterium]